MRQSSSSRVTTPVRNSSGAASRRMPSFLAAVSAFMVWGSSTCYSLTLHTGADDHVYTGAAVQAQGNGAEVNCDCATSPG